MQVVVDLPRLVADPDVVVPFAHGVEEHHEVGEEDLVHPAPRLEDMKPVGAGLQLDVARFAGQVRARGMNPLAMSLEHSSHRILRQPLDLEVRDEPAQLLGDGDVAPGMAEPDR